MEAKTAYYIGAATWAAFAWIGTSIYYQAQAARERRKHREADRAGHAKAWEAGIEILNLREAYEGEIHRADKAEILAEWRRQDITAVCYSYDKALAQVRATREALRRSNAVAKDARARAAKEGTSKDAQEQLKTLREIINTYCNAKEAGTAYQITLQRLRAAANPTAEAQAYQEQLAEHWRDKEERSRRAQREARARQGEGQPPQEGPTRAPGAGIAAGEDQSTWEAGKGQQGGQIPLPEGASQSGPVRAEE